MTDQIPPDLFEQVSTNLDKTKFNTRHPSLLSGSIAVVSASIIIQYGSG